MALTLPSLSAAAIDVVTGRFSTAWVGFFSRLAGPPAAIVAVAPTGSPYTFTAPDNGTLAIVGAVAMVQLTRARVTITVPSGLIPLSQGDHVTITYSAAPAISFIPRTA